MALNGLLSFFSFFYYFFSIAFFIKNKVTLQNFKLNSLVYQIYPLYVQNSKFCSRVL